jgi:hypothetical protein
MSETWRDSGYDPHRRQDQDPADDDRYYPHDGDPRYDNSRDYRRDDNPRGYYGWDRDYDGRRPDYDGRDRDYDGRRSDYDGRRRDYDDPARDFDGSRTRHLSRGRTPPAAPQPPVASGSMWGKQTGRFALATVFGGTILGGLVCVMFGAGPGWLLWFFVLAATVVAGFAAQQRACYLIIPAPAVAYPFAALPDGYASDPTAHGSLTALSVGVVQWMAHGFVVIVAATVLAIAITLWRWRQASRPHQGLRRRRPPRSAPAYRD